MGALIVLYRSSGINWHYELWINHYHCDFILVRHGVVEKKSGHLPDYDANLIAEQPALSALPSYLPEDALWYVSSRRTHQTFDIIAPQQAKFEIDNRLEEQNFGTWHGQKVSSVWQEISTMSKPTHPTSFVNPETRATRRHVF